MRYIIFGFLLCATLVNANSLKGKWVSKSGQRSVYLEFVSDSVLIYDQERMQYTLSNKNIRVPGEYGYVNYPYKLGKNTLRISFPEGYDLVFKRITREKSTFSGGDTYLLSGRLCNFSSSYNGGYASNRWVYFDGQGRFSTSLDSSYSGSSGSYYSKADQDGGRYSVNGDLISIDTDDGYHYDAHVIERQNSGQITGININGRVYGSAVCE